MRPNGQGPLFLSFLLMTAPRGLELERNVLKGLAGC